MQREYARLSNSHVQALSSSTSTESETNHELTILTKAINRKLDNDSVAVIQALRLLETKQRKCSKTDDGALAKSIRKELVGDWQLILVTDKKLESVIYLPVKNIFSIREFGSNPTPSTSTEYDKKSLVEVENAIRFGDYVVLSFMGTMEYHELKRQGLFDYDRFTALNYLIDFRLKPGQAERMVSTVEKRATSKTKKPLFGAYQQPSATRPFFNFFIVNEELAAARGSVGGFALWKRFLSNA
jgi:hypothetical protein